MFSRLNLLDKAIKWRDCDVIKVFTGIRRCGKSTINYFQVAESVQNQETLQWELAPLKEVKDNYPKFLITADFANEVDHHGLDR